MNNKSRSYFFRLAAVLAVIIGVVFFAWKYFNVSSSTSDSQNAESKPNPFQPPVQVATAEIKSIPHYLGGLGTVLAANTVTVTSQVEGQLIALHFNEGQYVKKGDLLAEIDPRTFQVKLARAQGQYAKDQATLANTKQDLLRFQQLAKSKLISQQELDKQISLVRQSEASLQADQADIDEAKLQLAYSRITAPISGRVGLKRIDIGNHVSGGGATPIVVITQVDPIDVVFSLPENDIGAVLKAQKNHKNVVVIAWDRNNQQQLTQGKLISIDNQIDVTTGTIKMKAQFNNQDNVLFPNQFVNIQMKVNTLDDVVVIPTAGLQMGNSGNFVWKVDKENKVSKHKVIAGLQDNQLAVINSGLSAGERVVTDGIDNLTEGAKVEIVKPLTIEALNADQSKKKSEQSNGKMENS
ncbi:MdtA/MuxA family multidrug efflux RND transporter periplasmic adaptor subunit [Xenorhabdus griffiniae]|uniref:Multidrug resistance protein MdtA n=1 Tax=Xenorhabdus griffiniae TaxID=351672 RepID=A0ABY9XLV2_9GAMM|nr:MdtA/MuxA family multidrug efflux RND transporter periplasmic adaptor subunit [Xenorhabdus griffiniae]MBD1228721.1 MdtA/MuxA family multidrug efflux RND transporter periplasmic adaptor subunit [Xenorhabdus griffiniae]MBE8588332.1 MdtA/MuxA family multidrug efflux RND transporter periplasmic adaptor subunit [Xenorhabdus griffiniae]WMV73913.1 MdtA/MuxA family multidrug efflux RND transporter periplasmic adaptor subunit [Xenorhabdus griffiniae]WNH03593.1 MdtA/MuxA family multidrug efflux RND tr